MQIFKNDYYDLFRCIAQACPDSCCKDWDVQVDEASAALYRSLDSVLGDRLRQVLRDDPEAGTLMTIENGRCPMWRDDSLCRIQAELGHDALCKTCREFPRLHHDYGDFVELQLELSCPEAARLILNASHAPMIETAVLGGDAPEYDTELMQFLHATRAKALELLYSAQFPVQEALAAVLQYAEQVQAALDGVQPRQIAPTEPADASSLPRFFETLEILTQQWRDLLHAPLAPAPWSQLHRNLARYGIERWWLQAVSDYDLLPRMKMIIAACLLVRNLGGDTVATAQLYSKEIENNIDNVEAILDAAYENPVFSTGHLLALLQK